MGWTKQSHERINDLKQIDDRAWSQFFCLAQLRILKRTRVDKMLKAFDGANNAIKMAINLRLLVWFINLFDKEEKGSIFPGNTESTDELKKQIFKWHMRS